MDHEWTVEELAAIPLVDNLLMITAMERDWRMEFDAAIELDRSPWKDLIKQKGESL